MAPPFHRRATQACPDGGLGVNVGVVYRSQDLDLPASITGSAISGTSSEHVLQTQAAFAARVYFW